MATDRNLRIVVISTPDRLDDPWIGKLAAETDIGRVERVAVLRAGIELVQQTRPDVVIIDRDAEQSEASIRQIFTSLPGTICIALIAQPDMALMRRLVLAGARDVLNQPVNYRELIESIRGATAMETDRRSRSMVSLETDRKPFGRGRLIVVTSPKGGAGTTTVATNLAIMLRQMSGSRVALADFSLQFGHIGVHLNLWSRHTLQDLLATPQEIDDAMLNPVMQQHGTGIHVLLAPNTPAAAADVTAEHLETIMEHLLERYSFVVADTWCVLDEVTMALLDMADEVLVMTTPEVPALKNVKFFLEYLRQNSMTKGRISIVLNRFPSVDGITLEDVQQHLRHPISANIPSAGQLVIYSVNRGVPFTVSHPQSWATQSIRKLAAYVAGELSDPLSLEPETGKAARPVNGRRGLLDFIRREA